jgi:DNA-binding transcriptional ArsR family regulator
LENRLTTSIDEHLKTLGVSRLSEWDVLAFLDRHGTNLVSAEQIARLLGYDKATVGAALDAVTSTGLVERSRSSQGVRLYRLPPIVDSVQNHSFIELMNIARTRGGRIQLIRTFQQRSKHTEIRKRNGLHLA